MVSPFSVLHLVNNKLVTNTPQAISALTIRHFLFAFNLVETHKTTHFIMIICLF